MQKTRPTHPTPRLGALAFLLALSPACDKLPIGGDAKATASETATGASTEESPDLAALVEKVQGMFVQLEHNDAQTGETLPYNLYLPSSYDQSKKYPLVLYIADASLVGQEVTAPLSQYGALIWASQAEQSKHPSIVLVPEFPEVILDDHDGFSMTAYVEMTTRLLDSVSQQYAVDRDRIYGTGQSMGCMTVMYLAAQDPDLFAAELLVSGQWDITALDGLARESFFYIAAAGDPKASVGQTEVKTMLTAAGVSFGTATVDATSSADELSAQTTALLADNQTKNFVTFKEGTVLEANPVSEHEHMASFEPAYRLAVVRDWLFEQGSR